ncbi:MAG: low molecular weight phosphotyrosine protein phosphatase [Clostridia bacterium]|nr:low molecular weight phosphotyrosine protein phosphatase [Clostridia bacterium]MDE7328255.1 low molecular weight phosphotyrosine protein phosphatase [Clostridia bacterium]
MHRIMFVCHGNICRSPMAEFVFKDIVEREGKEKEFFIASSATSCEELGNPVHRGTRAKLAEFGISCEGKRATRLKKCDYDKYDMFIAMDSYNVINMLKIFGEDPNRKIRVMLEFVGSNDDVADPWYTGDFDKTYEDIKKSCEALYLTFGE